VGWAFADGAEATQKGQHPCKPGLGMSYFWPGFKSACTHEDQPSRQAIVCAFLLTLCLGEEVCLKSIANTAKN
jgi:hypothetical protein